ncbi:MAG: hypothetical protein NTY03_02250 [Candidatus Bathyarchaeota archaeon]|jgi:hypothetical protein|nr:hypothetical protein [Candidatus Bathyarchaeota archaeon]
MNSITVNWLGPFSLNQITPRELMRKMGIYAVLNSSNYIFIGKAKRGKGIFRQATINREEEYWRGLRKLQLVIGELPVGYKLIAEVYDKCALYAGVVSRDDLKLVDDLERLLIYKLKPVCNDKFTKHQKSTEQIQVVNIGNPPTGLESFTYSLE